MSETKAIRNPLADALTLVDAAQVQVRDNWSRSAEEAELSLLRALAEAVRRDMQLNPPGELRTSGTYDDQWQSPVTLAEDYARWAAEKMNVPEAHDTEFIADGATVTAYVHRLAHMSATFALDEGRPYLRRAS